MTLHQTIENLEQLINERSVDFARMSNLVSEIKARCVELNISQQKLIESNAALVKLTQDLEGKLASE